MKDLHIHHILPKHLGGTNDPSNLTEPITRAEHAELHRLLWEKHGTKYDYIAWKALSGDMTSKAARLEAAKIGQNNSERYRVSRSLTGKHLTSCKTRESESKGGKAAAPALVEWQKENRSAFLARCSENGKATGPKLQIQHVYNGVHYQSKKALQADTGLSNTGFYGKLNRGEIVRIGRGAE